MIKSHAYCHPEWRENEVMRRCIRKAGLDSFLLTGSTGPWKTPDSHVCLTASFAHSYFPSIVLLVPLSVRKFFSLFVQTQGHLWAFEQFLVALRWLGGCISFLGFPGGSVVKNLTPVQEIGVWSLVGKIPWSRKWQPTPVFLPKKSHGQRSLVGYSVWGPRESDANEHGCHAMSYC